MSLFGNSFYSTSGILEVTIERDPEDEGWFDVIGIKGNTKRGCCEKESEECDCKIELMRLSDVECLDEAVHCDGVVGLWGGEGDEAPSKARKFKLTGKLTWETTWGPDGDDHTEEFEIEKVEDLV